MGASVAEKVMRGRSTALSAGSLVGPATLIVMLGAIAPLVVLFRVTFNRYDPRVLMIQAFTADNYIKFFSSFYYLDIFFTTLRIAVLCTVICLVAGFPLAYVIARTRTRFKNLLIIGVFVPLFVGNAVRAAGWMILLGSRGFVSVSLMDLGITSQPIQVMGTETAVILGIIAVTLPFMVLTLQSVLENVDRTLEEAAFSLGAGPMTMVRRVLWPLALPGISAGVILTFILTMNAYATPVLLGGPRFHMMAPLVYSQFTSNNWPFAAAAAFILMVTTLLLTLVGTLVTRQRFRG